MCSRGQILLNMISYCALLPHILVFSFFLTLTLSCILKNMILSFSFQMLLNLNLNPIEHFLHYLLMINLRMQNKTMSKFWTKSIWSKIQIVQVYLLGWLNNIFIASQSIWHVKSLLKENIFASHVYRKIYFASYVYRYKINWGVFSCL